MSDSSKTIECDVHGSTAVAYVCRHLFSGVGCGYIPSDGDPDDPWPDAWCSACDDVLDEEGGWSRRAEAFASIRCMCTGCYETARRLNDRPSVVDDATDDFDEFLAECGRHGKALNDRATETFALPTYDRWEFDPPTGRFCFTNDGVPRLVADAQVVGSFSTRSETWLWGWADTAVESHLVTDTRRLRVFGEVHDAETLTTDEAFEATEVDAWEFASLAATLLGADAIYRTPVDHLYTYFLLRNLRRAN